MLKGAVKDKQTVSRERGVIRDLIEGVRWRELRNIATRNGLTSELYRADWSLWPGAVQHMIHASFLPGAISAWHCHEHQTDSIVVTAGSLRLVLYDARTGSPTHGKVDVLNLSRAAPALVVIPPGIWHGLQNREGGESAMINYFDRAYVYEDPDEWRLPPDTDQIPYRF
jgi:dTDP-4-dehydrorhamnose 3,5-epimerase